MRKGDGRIDKNRCTFACQKFLDNQQQVITL